MSARLSIEDAIFLAALPYRRRFYESASVERIRSESRWQKIIQSEFSTLEIDAAQEHARRITLTANMPRTKELGHHVTIVDSNYPDSLLNIFDPPLALFASRSDWPDGFLHHRHVGIVGTRRALPIAEEATHQFVESLANQAAVIVSGFARGVDRVAHLASIRHGLPGVAVLGAGLWHAGPASNRDLISLANKEQVPLVFLSEFPHDVPGFPRHFPRRNRIIAGLCDSVNVMQAPHQSGALITARYALEEGREVCCFDHPLLSAPGTNEGARSLLADGASPISIKLFQVPDDTDPQLRLDFQRNRALGRVRLVSQRQYGRVD